MTEQQIITVSGYVRNKCGYFHMVATYKNRDGKFCTNSKSTGLKIRGNKKNAERLLSEYIKLKENELNAPSDQKDELPQQVNDKTNDSPLFTEYLLQWLDVMKPTLAATTYKSYSLCINNIIIPYFQNKNLRLLELKASDIQEFYDDRLKVVKANTVIHYHSYIRKALQRAYVSNLIPYNPADKIDKPKKKKYVGGFYNIEEIIELFEKVKDDILEVLIIVTVYYGLRRSEVLGLRWSAIDFTHKTISINHTVLDSQESGRALILCDGTKTAASHRIFPLLPPIEKLFLQLKYKQKLLMEVCKKDYCKDYLDYVMVNNLGQIIKPNYVTQHFAKILKKHNLRKIRFHDLRHSCASLLLSQGISMSQIQEWLGHESLYTTSGIYAHLYVESKQSTAATITNLLSSDL